MKAALKQRRPETRRRENGGHLLRQLEGRGESLQRLLRRPDVDIDWDGVKDWWERFKQGVDDFLNGPHLAAPSKVRVKVCEWVAVTVQLLGPRTAGSPPLSGANVTAMLPPSGAIEASASPTGVPAVGTPSGTVTGVTDRRGNFTFYVHAMGRGKFDITVGGVPGVPPVTVTVEAAR
jgi:hypothetical protein